MAKYISRISLEHPCRRACPNMLRNGLDAAFSNSSLLTCCVLDEAVEALVFGRLRIDADVALPANEAASAVGLEAWACDPSNCPITPPLLPWANRSKRSRAARALAIFCCAFSLRGASNGKFLLLNGRMYPSTSAMRFKKVRHDFRNGFESNLPYYYNPYAPFRLLKSCSDTTLRGAWARAG